LPRIFKLTKQMNAMYAVVLLALASSSVYARDRHTKTRLVPVPHPHALAEVQGGCAVNRQALLTSVFRGFGGGTCAAACGQNEVDVTAFQAGGGKTPVCGGATPKCCVTKVADIQCSIGNFGRCTPQGQCAGSDKLWFGGDPWCAIVGGDGQGCCAAPKACSKDNKPGVCLRATWLWPDSLGLQLIADSEDLCREPNHGAAPTDNSCFLLPKKGASS